MKKQVAIAVPVAQLVEPKTLESMMALVNYSAINGIEIVSIGTTKGMLIDDARNLLAETFLGSDIEWIFWMDSDMVFPKETLVELFKTAEEKNCKMVTGVYYQRKGKNFPVLWSRGRETEDGQISGMASKRAETNKYVGAFLIPHPDKKEASLAHAAGFGCTLIHREVFEVMDRPWFTFVQGVCSEDFYFFVNAKDLGYELWYNPVPELGHFGDAPIITKKDFHAKFSETGLEIAELKDLAKQ
jgi:hypothetical protein